MIDFEFLDEGIYRLCVPFEKIYTTVFLLVNENEAILYDAATTDYDVDNYIVPALRRMKTVPHIIVCSHSHRDHCGGIPRLLQHFPDLKVGIIDKRSVYGTSTRTLENNEILFHRFKVISLKGHSNDCIGILDLKTHTLISGDSLQQRGVDRFKTSITDISKYLDTINKLRKLDIDKIVSSHEYEPYGYLIIGKEAIERCYCECEQAIEELDNKN